MAESFLDLLKDAYAMLLDRHPQERKLIYHVAKMEPDLRAAIIIAYENLEREDEK